MRRNVLYTLYLFIKLIFAYEAA